MFAASGGVTPAIAADPADADRLVTELRVTSATGGDFSRVTYDFAANQPELWLEFDVAFQHAGRAIDGTLEMLRLIDSTGAAVVQLVRVGDSNIRWRSLNGADAQLSGLSMTGGNWVTLRLRYKSASGAGNDGILEAWSRNPSTGSYTSLVSVTNNAATDQVRAIALNCVPTSTLGGSAGNKIVWFRGLTWGTEQSHVGFKHRGLQFGHVCSASSSSTIDARLWYRFPREYHGTDLGGTGTPTTLSVQLQFKTSAGSTWSNSGSAVSLSLDGEDELIANHTVTGLSALTSYDFRAVVTDSASSFTITTEPIACTTPSASGGTPGPLKYAFGSCAGQQNVTPDFNPHPVMSRIREEGVHGFIHLGDMMYGGPELDLVSGSSEFEIALRRGYRRTFIHSSEQRRLLESAAFFPMWDDHELGQNNAVAAPNPPDALVQAIAAANAYWVLRRLNTIAGAKGWWFDTAKCRFIMMDMRSAKNVTSGSEKMLGDTQYDEVEDLLRNSPKPITFLFSPGPVVIGHGVNPSTHPDPDGWNHTPFTDERDRLFQAFHEGHDVLGDGSILIICSGDRHFAYIATDWGSSYGGKIKPEWCSSPLSWWQRTPVDLTILGSTQIYVEPEITGTTTVSRYCLIEIDEEALEVTMSLINGATGELLPFHTPVTYTATE